MSDYVLTKDGAKWMASRLSGKAPDLNIMYVVYANSSTDHTTISINTNAVNFTNLANDAWFMRVIGGISTTYNVDEDGSVSVSVSGIISENDKMPKEGSPSITTGKSKLISIAIGHTGDGDIQSNDVIVAVCNINPVMWVENTTLAVSCPIKIQPYPMETK